MLAETERALGFKLPVEYAAFLRTSNGGYPTPSDVATPSFPGSSDTTIGAFYSIDAAADYNDLMSRYRLWITDCPPQLLPVAYDDGGSEFCISLDGHDIGSIFYWDYYREEHNVDTNYPNIYPIAAGFDEFLASVTRMD